MDLIYREDLLKSIETAQKVIDKISNGVVNDTATITLETIRKIVDLLPAAQPERKMGWWLWTDEVYTCNQCHEALDEAYPFCPMCGADMRGDKKGEEDGRPDRQAGGN